MLSMVSKLVAFILMLQAAIHWVDWPRSNRLVFWAWLVTFSAPFLRSVVPTPLLIDWGPIDRDLDEYLRVSDHHFDLENRMESLAHVAGLTCHNHRMEEKVQTTWEETHHKVYWWCGKVEWGHQLFPWSNTFEKG